jgi:hypothetical protein
MMAVFWDAIRCSLVDTDVSEVSYITRDDKSPLKRRLISTTLHGTTSLVTAMFIPVIVRTLNLNKIILFYSPKVHLGGLRLGV